MALINCENVSFAYEGHVVVSELSLTIERGEYLCIVGENGSGKSTLVKGLLGLITPVKGKVVYGEGLKHTEIGYLPQRTDAQKDFPASVWEVAASGLRSRSPFLNQAQKAWVWQQLKLMSMDALAKRGFADLSGGQQQRVLLARALCATQTMLLLDEPVAGLDPLVTREMYEVIGRLHREQGLTVVMISHDIDAALACGDHILHLSHDSSFFGTPEEYRRSPLGRRFAGGAENA